MVDAVSALEYATAKPVVLGVDDAVCYHHIVFFTPPWPEIFATDADRRLGFDEASDEYGRLQTTYARLGYRIVVLPRDTVTARADEVLRVLASGEG